MSYVHISPLYLCPILMLDLFEMLPFLTSVLFLFIADLLTRFLQVVERSSALMNIDKEIFLQRDTNHTDLCRFRDEEDFEHIGMHIRRLARDAQKKMPVPLEVIPLSPRGMLVIS